MPDLNYSIRVEGGACKLLAGVSAANGCFVHVDGGPRNSAGANLSRTELRVFSDACIRMLDEQEGPVMDGWDLKAEGTLARLDVRSGGELVSLPMSSKSLALLGRAVSSLLKSAASEQPTALDAVDMRGPSAYCPGANGHTCDRGRLVECDEHGETDAGLCPRCNPPPPQTYRDRIGDLEHKLAAQQMSYESQQIDHLDRIAELERERDAQAQRATDAETAFRRERTRADALHAELSAERREVAALQDRYRPRRQSEEPAPDGAPIMRWNATTMRWQPSYGYELRPDHTWTHQPPAPGEGEAV